MQTLSIVLRNIQLNNYIAECNAFLENESDPTAYIAGCNEQKLKTLTVMQCLYTCNRCMIWILAMKSAMRVSERA